MKKAAKKQSGDSAPEYTETELAELLETHYGLVERHALTHAPDAALWRQLHGHIADYPAGLALRIAWEALNDSPHRSNSELTELLAKLGAFTAQAIQESDSIFFRQIAVVIAAKKEGRSSASLSRKELFLPRKRGRPQTPHDLSRVFPMALLKLTGRRFAKHAENGKFTPARITRRELMKQVREDGGTISEQELSRQLSLFDFGRFMAEQPIARKPTKSP